MQISGFFREQTRPYQTVGDEDVRPNGGNLKIEINSFADSKHPEIVEIANAI